PTGQSHGKITPRKAGRGPQRQSSAPQSRPTPPKAPTRPKGWGKPANFAAPTPQKLGVSCSIAAGYKQGPHMGAFFEGSWTVFVFVAAVAFRGKSRSAGPRTPPSS